MQWIPQNRIGATDSVHLVHFKHLTGTITRKRAKPARHLLELFGMEKNVPMNVLQITLILPLVLASVNLVYFYYLTRRIVLTNLHMLLKGPLISSVRAT